MPQFSSCWLTIAEKPKGDIIEVHNTSKKHTHAMYLFLVPVDRTKQNTVKQVNRMRSIRARLLKGPMKTETQ